MIVSWANSTHTLVRVVDDQGERVFPPISALPAWAAILAAVEAGTLTITDFAPPPPPAQD